MNSFFRMFRPRDTTFILAVVILGFGLYANSLNGQFLWDDHHFITGNIYIKDWRYLPKLFTQTLASGHFVESTYYRPIQELSYMIDYHLWGLNVQGYHLTNILLHILNTILLFYFLNCTQVSRPGTILASLLFLVHPVNAEAVSALAGRGEPLAALFMLLCLIYYHKNTDDFKMNRAGLIFLSYTLALFTKENTIIFPLVLFVYHFAFRKKATLKTIWPITLSIVVYFTTRMTLVHSLPNVGQRIEGGAQRLPGFFDAFVRYLKIFFIPTDLHFDYGQPTFTWAHPSVVAGILLIIGLIITAWKWREQKPFQSFAIGWFLVTLAPYTNVYLLYSYMAEHYLYFPSMGFFMLVAGMGATTLSHKTGKLSWTILFIILGSLTIWQTNYWRDALIFLNRTISYNPTSAGLYNNLGVEYSRRADIENEIKAYKRALHFDPNYALAHRNLGIAYYSQGQLDAARASLERALMLEREDIKTRNALAVVYQKQGLATQAIQIWEETIWRNPDFAGGYNNLGALYSEENELDKAVYYLQKAVAIDSTNTESYFNLAVVYYKKGELEKADAVLTKILQLNGRHSPAYFLKKEIESRKLPSVR